MKYLTFSLLLVSLLLSCSTKYHAFKSEDTSKSVKSIEMTDKLSIYPVGTSKKKSSEKLGNAKTIYRFEAEKIGKVNASVEFISGAQIFDTVQDSLVYLVLEGEKIGLSKLSERKYEVPENLWVPIANSDKIEYRIHQGKADYELYPDEDQTNNLKYFFKRAIQYRDANLPSLPEGLKKW